MSEKCVFCHAVSTLELCVDTDKQSRNHIRQLHVLMHTPESRFSFLHIPDSG